MARLDDDGGEHIERRATRRRHSAQDQIDWPSKEEPASPRRRRQKEEIHRSPSASSRHRRSHRHRHRAEDGDDETGSPRRVVVKSRSGPPAVAAATAALAMPLMVRPPAPVVQHMPHQISHREHYNHSGSKPPPFVPPAPFVEDEYTPRSDGRRSSSYRGGSPRSGRQYRSTPDSRRSLRTSDTESESGESEVTMSSAEAEEEEVIVVDKQVMRERIGGERVRSGERGRDRERERERERQRERDRELGEERVMELERAERRAKQKEKDRLRERQQIRERERESRSRESRDRDRERDRGSRDRDAGREKEHVRTRREVVRETVIYEEESDDNRYRRPGQRRSGERHRSPSPLPSEKPPRRRSSHRRAPSYKAPSIEAETRPHRSSSKRSSRRYYESEAAVTHDRLPSLRRAHTGGSQTASTHSATSSRRSSFRSFFGIPGLPHVPDGPPKLVECVVCMEEQPSQKMAKLKCGHRRCNACLKRQFKLSITDPQLMPPKCCDADHIPLRHVEGLFDNRFKRMWNHKFHEYSTRNRVYCPSRRCGEWIAPRNIIRDETGRKVARCGKCRTKVCCACGRKHHTSPECPNDEETNRFLEQAKEEGWQRCHRCKAVVELKEGCNHMTCRCGAEFCMSCGTKWKECDCPWFNYDDEDPLDLPGPFDNLGPPRPNVPMAPGVPGGPRVDRFAARAEELTRRIRDEREHLSRRFGPMADEDDFTGGIGDIVGIGNGAGHFMNDDYMRRADTLGVTAQPLPPPMPIPLPPGSQQPPPPGAILGRSSTGDYVSGVARARGVRASSLERRLADRFSTDHRTPPSYRHTAPAPPPPGPHPSAAGMPPMPPPPPMMMSSPMGSPLRGGVPPPGPGGPIMRRHTMEDTMYGAGGGPLPYHGSPGRYMPPPHSGYPGDAAAMMDAAMMGRMPPVVPGVHHVPAPPALAGTGSSGKREDGTPKMSLLAGLSGPGRGMGRVHEWMDYVEPGEPEGETGSVKGDVARYS